MNSIPSHKHRADIGVHVTVEIPAGMRRHACGQASVGLFPPPTVREALNLLVLQFPALGPQIFAGDGQIFGFVSVFLNTRDIRQLDGMNESLSEGDVITLVPAIAGG
jgi:molybdopterin converting factor small subunit